MNEDMNTKYQQYHNQILSGTLTETIIKSISYQANIKLANEIIADQEKLIEDLNKSVAELKYELESTKNNITNADNTKISSLETNLRLQGEQITKLNTELSNANRLKAEIESLRSRAQNAETFRNQLVKEREEHQKIKNDFETQIAELKNKIEILEAPPKKKKTVKSVDKTVVDEVQQSVSDGTVKDGGSF